ncbi:MAG: hypothetical protein FWD96_03440 [Defluviitaleaceae bacterium]|nr:hypothetical protein [Defluviitaleaceae bacterium]
MISKETIDNICNHAKVRLDEKDIEQVNILISILDGIDKINLDTEIDLMDLELVNTYREDVTRPSMPRADILSVAKHINGGVAAGCVNVPGKLRGE